MAAGIILPSDGSHGFFTPKSLLFVSAVLSVGLMAIIRQKFHPKQLYHGLFLSFFLCFLIFWLIIGIANPMTLTSSAFDQTKLFLVTITVPLMTLYLYRENLIDPRKILRIVILSNFAYCLVKLLLISLHLGGVFNMWDFLHGAGIRIQQMSIVSGLQRLQTSVDISTPFLFMFVLFSEELGLSLSPFLRRCYLLAAVLSNLFTFSRYLLVIQAAAFFLYLCSVNSRKFVKAASITLAVIIFAVAVIGPQPLKKSIEQRFFSLSSSQSDQARVEQVNALMEHAEDSPYFGQGLGAHAPKAIRDHTLLHSYEVQWAAFLMQLGIVGVSILLVSLLLIALPLLKPPLTRPSLAFFFLFTLWILSGFTNPFLISLQSGIIYSLFLTVGWLLPSRKFA